MGKADKSPTIKILLPEHLITELLRAIHGQMGKHPGIKKLIQEC